MRLHWNIPLSRGASRGFFVSAELGSCRVDRLLDAVAPLEVFDIRYRDSDLATDPVGIWECTLAQQLPKFRLLAAQGTLDAFPVEWWLNVIAHVCYLAS